MPSTWRSCWLVRGATASVRPLDGIAFRSLWYKGAFNNGLRMRTNRVVALIIAALLAGCSTSQVKVMPQARGDRVVALDAPRTPWVIEIEQKLREAGYRVLRHASGSLVQERTAANRIEQYRESTTRYVLVVQGSDIPSRRCFGGGYTFSSISAEVVDTRTNETVSSMTGSGYSENCQPMSGRIFADIVRATDAAFER